MVPRKCPNCGCTGSMIAYRALVGPARVPRQILRCVCCNTGAVAGS